MKFCSNATGNYVLVLKNYLKMFSHFHFVKKLQKMNSGGEMPALVAA